MIRFDAHCHVFNGRILADAVRLTAKKGDDVRASWWSWIAELIDSVLDSEKSHNKFLVKSLRSHFPEDTPVTCPLAMDIRYLFAPSLKMYEQTGVENESLFLNPGLVKQMKALKALSAKGNCYPFFPVDPRRPGIVKAVLAGDIVTRKPGGFYGIKLYPRLGYHPLSSNLWALYEYCEVQGIPITTHASSGGFPPYGTSSGDFANPENYKTILMRRPNLRINFAHWGHGKEQWSNTILEYMKSYPHVYADLACYNAPGDLRDFKKAYWGYQKVRDRTLYGSDYDIFYLTETKFDMDSYIESFVNIFTEEEVTQMMCHSPSAFMGLGGNNVS